jgi:hypothetical protein
VAALDAVIQFSSFKNTSRHIRIYHLSRSANGAESRLAKKVVKIRPRPHLYTHPPDAVSKSSSAIILKMLRQAFRLRQRSILQQVHFPATYNTRTFHRTTRKTYHSASTAKSSPHFSASLDGKVNNIQSEMAATKSATKSEMAHLARKIDMIDTEMKSLSNNLTMQMKNLIETVSTQIDAINANMELRTVNMELNMDSRLDKLENRFNLLFGMLFAVSGLRIYYTAF